ncbi:MAG: ACT domain-containing protein, partial [Desulfovibrio sp.]|nr:ACT domain-containing protein [Desulfovibrio sp.]
MQDIVLIRISGEDRPGLLAELCEAMAQNDVEILDVGQSVIYDSLNLGMLIRIPPEAERAPVLKDILFKA